MLLKNFQDSSDYPVVFLQSFCEDEDIIQVYHYYAFRNEIFEDSVHYGLEGSWTIGQAKEHNQWFIQALLGASGIRGIQDK